MRIIILGAGLQGNIVLTDLMDKELSPDKKQVKILNRTEAKARQVAAQFEGVEYAALDIINHAKFVEEIKGYDVVVNCTQYDNNIRVMNACLEAGCNYIDLGGLFHVTKEQFKLHDEFVKKGLTAILGMGSTPGTMNVMAGYAAAQLDTIDEAHAICACADFTSTRALIGIPYSLKTVIEEHTMEPWILHKGELMPVSAGSGKEKIDFGAPVGEAEAVYCIHSEPVQFARSFAAKGIQEASFKLSLPKEFEDKLTFLTGVGFGSDKPIKVGNAEVSPQDVLIAVVNDYVKQYDPSGDGQLNDCDVLRAVVKGKAAGVEKEYVVESVIRTSTKWGFMAGALDTGVPPSIVAQMICKGQVKEKGVLAPEQAVLPIEYFKQLELRDMPVSVCERTPISSNTFVAWDTARFA